MSAFLQFQGSQPGLFSTVSTGEFCPLRIPLDKPLDRELEAERLWAAASPIDTSRKDGGLPLVTSEKTHYLSS